MKPMSKENTTAQCVVQHDEGVLPWWNDLPDRTMYLSFLWIEKLSPDDCSSWTSILLILLSILLTGAGIYPLLAKWGGAGALVPITGFANSVAAPAIEYKKEGQVLVLVVRSSRLPGLWSCMELWQVGRLELYIGYGRWCETRNVLDKCIRKPLFTAS